MQELKIRLKGALLWTQDALPVRFQFNGLECAQLVADTFKRPVVILEEDTNPTTFIPLEEPSPSNPSPSDPSQSMPIVFRYTRLNNMKGHYDLFQVKERCMFPAINGMYTKIGMDIAERTSNLQQVFAIEERVVAPPPVIDLLDD